MGCYSHQRLQPSPPLSACLAMNRLSNELQRLYLPHEQTHGLPSAAAEIPSLIGSDARVRALVMAFDRAAGWNAAGALWQGVQDELGLPAPAIAVAGRDGYQLWFSLQEAVSVTQAQLFLDRLRQRLLGDIDPRQVRLLPASDAAAPQAARHARLIPLQLEEDRWSAFVAPDLAALFNEEPWLDLPPGPEAQADLLLRLHSITPEQFGLALQRLSPRPLVEDTQLPPGEMAETGTAAGHCRDPRQFLLDVMNDRRVEMGLRIEAAKALLAVSADRQTGLEALGRMA